MKNHVLKRMILTAALICFGILLLGTQTFATEACDDDEVQAESIIQIDIDPFGNENGERIQNGVYWTTNTLYVWYGGGLSSNMITAISSALNTWDYVSMNGLLVHFSFVETTSEANAQIRFNYVNQLRQKSVAALATTTHYLEDPQTHIASQISSGVPTFCRINFYNPPYPNEYSFNSYSESGKYNFESVALHEIGHALGIAHCHTDCPNNNVQNGNPACIANVMCGYIKPNMVRNSLQTYDIASLISIYCVYHPFPS